MVQSAGFKNFMAKLYGFGAAIVILGAMFKILHLPGSGIMLGVGLTVEAVIFFFSAFEKPHEEPDWSLVYPELAGMDGDSFEEGQHVARRSHGGGGGGGGSNDAVAQELDRLMAEANIGPELIESLGNGLRNFGEKVQTISNVVDTSVSTEELNEKIRTTTSKVDELGNTYGSAATAVAEKVEAMDSAYENASNTINEKVNELGNACNNAAMAIEQVASQTSNNGAYTEQVEALTKNLSALNSVYEMELQETNSHLKQVGELHGSFNQTMTALSDSLEDAEKYREEVGKLAKNLASLNAVYGNMLSAMNAPVNS